MPKLMNGLKAFCSLRAEFFVPFATLPVLIPFAVVDQLARGELIWLLVTVIALFVRVRWDLRDRRWFWVVLSIYEVIHAPLVWWNPLHGKHVPGAVILPFMYLDFSVLTVWCSSQGRF